MRTRISTPAAFLSGRRIVGATAALATSAIALGLAGVGGIGTGAAAGEGEAPVFVPIAPCRLADTRAGSDHVGSTDTLQPDAVVTFAAHGTNGNCTLPADATGLSLNVTAVNQSALTYLTVYPTGAERPKASHLNPAPGQPPTPNAVNVDVDPEGHFDMYNKQGTVDVIVDVVGYYADHHHDGRYAALDHAHDDLYAPLVHDHGDQYAAAGHDHDDRYYTEPEVLQQIDNKIFWHANKPVTLNLSPWGLTGRNTSGGNVHPNAPFVPYDYNDTGCVRNGSGQFPLMMPVNLPVGAVVTNVSATTIDVGTGAGVYYVYLSSDTATGAPQTVAELSFGNNTTNGTAIVDAANPIPGTNTVENNEHFYIHFNPGADVAALCRVSVTYHTPG